MTALLIIFLAIFILKNSDFRKNSELVRSIRVQNFRYIKKMQFYFSPWKPWFCAKCKNIFSCVQCGFLTNVDAFVSMWPIVFTFQCCYISLTICHYISLLLHVVYIYVYVYVAIGTQSGNRM